MDSEDRMIYVHSIAQVSSITSPFSTLLMICSPQTIQPIVVEKHSTNFQTAKFLIFEHKPHVTSSCSRIYSSHFRPITFGLSSVRFVGKSGCYATDGSRGFDGLRAFDSSKGMDGSSRIDSPLGRDCSKAG